MPADDHEMTPVRPAEPRVVELTVKAVVLGVVLAIVLAAANAYLGLFAGTTFSASIPAAVMSLGLLRLFRRRSILESNIVQTAASAGEALAGGVIFTLPALYILGQIERFGYWQTTIIAALGGTIGVLFTVPLRRALLGSESLRFPEGVATAEVLKAGEAGGSDLRLLFDAGLVGAVVKLCTAGFRLWGDAVEVAGRAGGSVFYFGSYLSPALVAVGYILRLNMAVLVFMGGALHWLVVIPVMALTYDASADLTALELSQQIWLAQTRYLGVGAMAVGGLWALIRMRRSLATSLGAGFVALRHRAGLAESVRTERDLPMTWVVVALLAAIIPLCILFYVVVQRGAVALVMAPLMLVAGFVFAAVAAYMAGLVGSANNPISGITLATVLTTALILAALFGTGYREGPAAAILIGAVVCCAAAIAGDNMQDLKAGQILGATPAKQQLMQVIGVIAASFTVAPVLNLLLDAYGIGAPNAAHPQSLSAPQATIIASVARGVFHGDLPWAMIAVGAAIAVGVIACDLWLERRGSRFRMPVLAVAVGTYLPLKLSVPIALGGLIAWAAERVTVRAEQRGDRSPETAVARQRDTRRGLLGAAGLITGEALVGIGVAIPIVVSANKDCLALFGEPRLGSLGVVVFLAVVGLLYWLASAEARRSLRLGG